MIRQSGHRWSVTRRRTADPRILVDLLIAAVIATLALGDVASASSSAASGERRADALAYALVLAGAISLVWRRRTPVAVLAFVTAVVVTYWLRGYGAFLSVLGLPTFYAVAVHAEHRRRAWWALGASFVALLAAAGVSVLDRPDGFAYFAAVSMTIFLIAAGAAGVIIRNRERIFVDTERRAAQAEADRLAEAERAVVRERSRIAREMHDVVAHGMSVIAVQAAAGQEIVRTNPDKAAEVFARIEAVGRESLMELRRMLGVLRDGGDTSASLVPQPGIADIEAVVAQSSTTDMAIELVIDGDQRALPAGIELAAYRIVQEALTNVRKHAGASASTVVHITFEPHRLIVEVVDDGRGAATALSGVGAGNGLIGMRERVEVYGGEFSAGPRRGGGYGVRAMLPIADGERHVDAPAGEQWTESTT